MYSSPTYGQQLCNFILKSWKAKPSNIYTTQTVSLEPKEGTSKLFKRLILSPTTIEALVTFDSIRWCWQLVCNQNIYCNLLDRSRPSTKDLNSYERQMYDLYPRTGQIYYEAHTDFGVRWFSTPESAPVCTLVLQIRVDKRTARWFS